MKEENVPMRLIALPGRLRQAAARVPTRRIGLNSIWLLLARLAAQVQLLLLTVLIARRLGQAGFGQYSLIASVVVLGNVLTTFGTDTLLIRRIAQSRSAGSSAEGSQLTSALLLQLVLSALFVGVCWLWTGFSGQESTEFSISLRIYSLSLFPLAFFSVFTAVLRGYERMDLYLTANLASGGVQLIMVCLVLWSGGGLTLIMTALLLVQFVTMGVSYRLCRPYLPLFVLRQPGYSRFLGQMAYAALPLGLLSVLGVIYQRLGILSLSTLGSAAQVGLFSAASRLVEALKIGHIAILGALLPALSVLNGQPRPTTSQEAVLYEEQAGRIFKQSVWGLLGLSLAGILGASLFAGPLVAVLYGGQYLPAVPALRILVWLLLPYSLSASLTVGMITKGREKLVTAVLAASIGVGLLLYLVWVPWWGLAGACMAAVAAEAVQAGALSYFYFGKAILARAFNPVE